MLTSALLGCFGGYAATFDLNNLLNKADSTSREALNWGFLLATRGSRVLLSNECKIVGKKSSAAPTLSGVMIKSLTSACDVLTAAQPHCAPESLRSRAFVVLLANELPPVVPPIGGRLSYVSWELSYQAVPDGAPQPDGTLPADETLKANFLTNRLYHDALFALLVRTYNEEVKGRVIAVPACVQKESREQAAPNELELVRDLFANELAHLYVLTRQPLDRLPFAELHRNINFALASKNMAMDRKKLGGILTQLGVCAVDEAAWAPCLGKTARLRNGIARASDVATA